MNSARRQRDHEQWLAANKAFDAQRAAAPPANENAAGGEPAAQDGGARAVETTQRDCTDNQPGSQAVATETLLGGPLPAEVARVGDLTLTTFANLRMTTGTHEVLAWSDLCERLAAPDEYATKEAMPLLALARFEGDSRAKGSAVRSLSGAIGDYDAGAVSIEEAAARLRRAGIEAFLYTSASHTPEAPRWRVLAPFGGPLPPQEYREHMDALNGALGDVLAPESWQPSRLYFYGRKRGAEYRSLRVEGQRLDVLMLTAALPAIPQPGATCEPALPREREGTLEAAVREQVLETVTGETVEEVRSAIAVLSSESYDDWIRVGQALKSLEQAGFEDEARVLWHEFSARSAKYRAEQADEKWATFDPGRITFKSIFKWAQAAGWVNPRSREGQNAATRIDRTDTGNANLLAQIVAGDLRYVTERRIWICWEGGRWLQDTSGVRAQAAALRVAEHYDLLARRTEEQRGAPGIPHTEKAKLDAVVESQRKWVAACRSRKRVTDMLAIASKDARFVVSAAELDRDPWLFGVANGVVDLRTGALRPEAREDFVTQRSPIAFDPGAKAPRWHRFVNEITAAPLPGGKSRPRPALAAYLHRMLGYCLTGETREHKLFLAVGSGSNGKSVLLDTLQWLLGDYARTLPAAALMSSGRDADAERASPVAASLAGGRLAVAAESGDGHRLDAAMVKLNTGGGFLTARLLHQNPIRFEMTHKLMLMTNHRPTLDHLDEALRGRLHLIPFDMRWNRPGHPVRDPALPDGDKDLVAALRAEAAGILAWLVAGAVAYNADGLEPPGEVVTMTRTYFDEQDPLGAFLAAGTVCEAKAGTGAAALHEAFAAWCSQGDWAGAVPSPRAFGLALVARGVEKLVLTRGALYGVIPPAVDSAL